MLKTLTTLFVCLFSSTLLAQHFEGKIIYNNQFKSRMQGVNDEYLTSLMGNTQIYFIKGGNYKSEINGSMLQWQLYVNADNKLYNKLASTETLMYNDGKEVSNEIIKTELNKNVTEVLGYMCDELIITGKKGVEKYYFNSNISVDPALFINHKYGSWYDFVSKSNALPLKIIIDFKEYYMESTATEVVPQKLEESFFKLPAGIKTIKSTE